MDMATISDKTQEKLLAIGTSAVMVEYTSGAIQCFDSVQEALSYLDKPNGLTSENDAVLFVASAIISKNKKGNLKIKRVWE